MTMPATTSAAATRLALQALAAQPITILVEPPGPRAREMIAREKPFLSPSLIHCYPLVVRRASGCMVEDVDGNVYLDVQAGVATASTGHCHPDVTSAIASQAETLIHICGTDFHYPGYAAICEKLATLAQVHLGPSRRAEEPSPWQVYLSNSGAEAVEGAIKLARYHTHRSGVIAFRGGFHGRTYGALSLTASKAKYRKGFGPFLPGVYHATYGDPESVERELFGPLVGPEDIAAIVVEPVLGEGGYIVPSQEFLERLRAICDVHGILLVFDEVQTGLGRTGRMFAAEHFGVRPDIMVLAKGLASGMPLGAIVAQRQIMTWPAGSHGSTMGGNPVCIAASLATLRLLEGGLVDNAAKVGGFLKDRLQTLLAGNEQVDEVRGLGLMIGVELKSPELAQAVAHLCFRRGLLVLECGRKAIRISPPLIIGEGQADSAAEVFAQACRDVRV